MPGWFVSIIELVAKHGHVMTIIYEQARKLRGTVSLASYYFCTSLPRVRFVW